MSSSQSLDLHSRLGAAERVQLHSAVVRIAHWIVALSFIALLVSGTAILVAHPRFYWGETGAIGAPSLFDLPIPLVLGHSGWGRYLHFLAAWACVLAGLTYVCVGLFTQHFRNRLLPRITDLTWHRIKQVVSDHVRWQRPREADPWDYNVVQRLTYLAVVFVLFPLILWTGLAMSPTITSVCPALVTILGGQQSARTIHFLVANLLFLFLIVHVVMLCLVGFSNHVRAMVTGHATTGKESS